eukprot:GSChrysophyteH1.ASY1.ANO1.1886.1 assembled CDS
MPISREKKAEYFVRMKAMLLKYSKVFIVNVDNVGSASMNKTRLQMRGRAEILMGKNTMMRKVLGEFLEENPDHYHGSLDARMRGNVGFVFTNDELCDIRDFILANRVPAPARVGSIAPIDVSIPAGPTGVDPGQTSFFQVLQIPTKIVKGQIEITNVMVVAKVAALSFATNTCTQASIVHSIANAFKTMVAVTIGLENYTFAEAAPYKK